MPSVDASEVKQLRKKLDDKDDEIDQLKASVESGSEQLQGLHQALAAKNFEIDDLKDQLKSSQSGASGSNVRIKELEAKVADLEPQLEDALHDVRSLMTKCEHMQRGLSQAQERENAFAKTKEELDGVRSSLDGLQAEHAQLNQQHEEAQNALRAHQQQQCSIHERIHAMEQNLVASEEALRQEQASRESDQHHFTEAETNLRNQLEQQQTQTEQIRVHAHQATEQHTALQAQLDTLRSELNEASQKAERNDHTEGVLKNAIAQVSNLKSKLAETEVCNSTLQNDMDKKSKEHGKELEQFKTSTLKPVQDARRRAEQAVNSLQKEQGKVTKFKRQFREQEDRANAAEKKVEELLSTLANTSTMAEETRHRLEQQCYELAQETDALRTGEHIPEEKLEKEVRKILLKHELESAKEPANLETNNGYTIIPPQMLPEEVLGENDGWTTVIDVSAVAVNGGSNADLMISAEIEVDGIIDQLRVMMYDNYADICTNFLARNKKSPLFIKPLCEYLRKLEKENPVLPIIAPPKELMEIYHEFEGQ